MQGVEADSHLVWPHVPCSGVYGPFSPMSRSGGAGVILSLVIPDVVGVGVGLSGVGGSVMSTWSHWNFILCSMLTLSLSGWKTWCPLVLESNLTQCASLDHLSSLELAPSWTQIFCPHLWMSTKLGLVSVSA